MKKVGRFTSHTTAHLAKEALLNHGISSEIIGAKEYSSIIVGGDHGRYDLMVDWKDETEATKIIKGFDIQIVQDTDSTSDSQSSNLPPEKLLRKAIVMALLAAVVLPIVFNYASLKNLAQYWQAEPNSTKRIVYGAIVIALQFLTVIFTYYAFKTLTTDIPLDYLNELN